MDPHRRSIGVDNPDDGHRRGAGGRRADIRENDAVGLVQRSRARELHFRHARVLGGRIQEVRQELRRADREPEGSVLRRAAGDGGRGRNCAAYAIRGPHEAAHDFRLLHQRTRRPRPSCINTWQRHSTNPLRSSNQAIGRIPGFQARCTGSMRADAMSQVRLRRDRHRLRHFRRLGGEGTHRARPEGAAARRGRSITPADYLGEHKPAWQFPFRQFGDRKRYERDYPIQSTCYAFGEPTEQIWVKDTNSRTVRIPRVRFAGSAATISAANRSCGGAATPRWRPHQFRREQAGWTWRRLAHSYATTSTLV